MERKGKLRKEKENYVLRLVGRGNSPCINQGEGDTLAQKTRESPPPRSCKKMILMHSPPKIPIWGSGGSLEAPGSMAIIWLSTLSGDKLVGIHDKMGMKFASKFIGTLVVKSQLLKLAKGVLSVAGPTNT
eukprot:1039490-Pelagomonas_calceolata.AAC.1